MAVLTAMQQVAEALSFLEWVDRVLNRTLQIHASASDETGAHLFLDVLDGIEAERERISGIEQPSGWPTDLWYGYRVGLVVTEERLRAAFGQYPAEPSQESADSITEALTWLRNLRQDIGALEGGRLH